MASGTMVLDDVSAGWQTTTRPRPHAAEQSSQILADSRAMRAVMELIDRAARTTRRSCSSARAEPARSCSRARCIIAARAPLVHSSR